MVSAARFVFPLIINIFHSSDFKSYNQSSEVHSLKTKFSYETNTRHSNYSGLRRHSLHDHRYNYSPLNSHMKTQIFNSYQEFQEREDKTINGVSQNVALIIKDWESDNETNQGCWNCTRCTGCVDCYDCYDCHDCTDCTTCSHSSSCNNCNSVQSCVGCVGISQTSNRQFEVL